MWTENFQMYKRDLEKAEEPEIKLPTSVGLHKKQINSKKTSTPASLTMLEPLTVWITTNCAKFLKKWKYQTTLPAFWETCMQVKKQQNWMWNNRLVIKLGKEYVKAVYCHPAYLTSMRSTSWETEGMDKAQSGIKIARRNINNLRYADDTTLMVESEEELKSLLMKVKEES